MNHDYRPKIDVRYENIILIQMNLFEMRWNGSSLSSAKIFTQWQSELNCAAFTFHWLIAIVIFISVCY